MRWVTRLCVRVLPITLRTSSRGSSRGRKRSPCFTTRRSKSGGRSSEKLASRRSEFFEKLPNRNVGSWWKLTYGPGRRGRALTRFGQDDRHWIGPFIEVEQTRV